MDMVEVSSVKYKSGRNLFKDFAQMRESLIFQYKKGDLNKKEYVRQSHDLLIHFEATPFNNVDSFDKAVFNYHYYNTMAKYTRMKAEELRKSGKHPDLYRHYIERKDHYYRLKDRMTWKAVSLLDFQDVEAYHIKVRSGFLKENLFEVVFRQYPTVVFHSRGQWLQSRLEEEGIFDHRTKRSVIESYVNEKY
jgi:hypothetical protein